MRNERLAGPHWTSLAGVVTIFYHKIKLGHPSGAFCFGVISNGSAEDSGLGLVLPQIDKVDGRGPGFSVVD